MPEIFPDIAVLNLAFSGVGLRTSLFMVSPPFGAEFEDVLDELISRLTNGSKVQAPALLAAAALQAGRTSPRSPPASGAEPPEEPEPAWLPSSPRWPAGGSGCSCLLL